ncbi:hypothetical protein C8R47DRAFT_1078609, partial [Mycena vitilis]
ILVIRVGDVVVATKLAFAGHRRAGERGPQWEGAREEEESTERGAAGAEGLGDMVVGETLQFGEPYANKDYIIYRALRWTEELDIQEEENRRIVFFLRNLTRLQHARVATYLTRRSTRLCAPFIAFDANFQLKREPLAHQAVDSAPCDDTYEDMPPLQDLSDNEDDEDIIPRAKL